MVFKSIVSEQSIVVGKRIRDLRKKKGLTQEEFVKELAPLLGGKVYARSTVANWERGALPTPDILQILSQYFNVAESYLNVVMKSELIEEPRSVFRLVDSNKLDFLDGEVVFCEKKVEEKNKLITGQWGVVDSTAKLILFSSMINLKFKEADALYNIYYRPAPVCSSATESFEILNSNEVKRIRNFWVELISTNDRIRTFSDFGEYYKDGNNVKLNNGIVLSMSHYGKAFVCYDEKPQVKINKIVSGLASSK